MAEPFACAACGQESEGDVRVDIIECVLCRRMYCEGCLNKEGLCTECEGEHVKQAL